MASSIRIWAWAFAVGVLMTVAVIAVWKAGAVEGGFVLTIVSTGLTLIIAVTGLLALASESRKGREAISALESGTRPPVQPSATPRREPPGRAGAQPDAVGPKFHVETQGGTAYVAETMTFTPESRAGRGHWETGKGGTSRAE